MRRSRLLILVGLVLLLGAGAVLLLSGFLGNLVGGPAATPTPAVSPTPEAVLQVVVAGQNIPRGAIIPADQLVMVPWPKTSLLSTMITDTVQVVGRIARIDIAREQPILNSMIVENLRDLGATGSDAALQIPPGMVGVAVPYTRLSGVAYAVADGDRVDIIASFLFVDLDIDFQTLTPNAVWGITYAPANGATAGNELVPVVSGGAPFSLGKPAEDVFTQFFTNMPGVSPIPFYLVPSEAQRPRLVTQRIIQNAAVLHVGTFVPPEPTAVPTPTLAPNQPTPTPVPGAAPVAEKQKPDIITLVVSPQEAAVLTYLMAANVDLTFALRSAGDATVVDTESVTLQSLVDKYKIAIPAKVEYGLEPPLRDIVPPRLPNDPTPAP